MSPVRMSVLVLGSAAFAPLSLMAQAAQDDLESLLNLKVQIATQKVQPLHEAPSAVSVITRADIERYGWRELSDILRTVPGIEFAHDSQSLIGISVRGVWAHEGKNLLLVNGVQATPLTTGNLNYYGQYPAALIERIEIIRGPGSANYGQFAGAIVINIITRSPDDPAGGRVALSALALNRTDSGTAGVLTASGRLKDTLRMSLTISHMQGPFSGQVYRDFQGGSFDQSGANSRREHFMLSTEIRAENTTFSFLRTENPVSQHDGSSKVSLPVNGIDQNTSSRIVEVGRVRHDIPINDTLRLEANLGYDRNTGGSLYPMATGSRSVNNSGLEMTKFDTDLGIHWNLPWQADLAWGVGFIRDRATSVMTGDQPGLRGSRDPNDFVYRQQFTTRFSFFQYTQTRDGLGLTAGARYEDTTTGSAFAPRLGVTWVSGRFNAKLLYAEAFRIPTVFQTYSRYYTASFKGFIRPERLSTSELELGWQLLPGMVGRMNLFRTRVADSITYSGTELLYVNQGTTLSNGLEASLDLKRPTYGGFANLSLVRPGSGTPRSGTTEDGVSFLAVPEIKANLGAYTRWGLFQIAPSLTWLGPRYNQSQRSALTPGLIESERLPSRVMVNLSMQMEEIRPNFDLRFSVLNLFNADVPMLQPYYGNHAPLPANDRRASLTVVWHF